MDIYNKIDAILTQKGMSRRKLAVALKIAPSTFQTMMQRKRGITADVVKSIADYFKMPVGNLYIDDLHVDDLYKKRTEIIPDRQIKNTGIVRRIDDLGRIQIPKELRCRLHIIEGDPLELYVENDSIVFKKYDASETIKHVLDRTTDHIISETANLSPEVTDALIKKLSEMKKILKHGDTVK